MASAKNQMIKLPARGIKLKQSLIKKYKECSIYVKASFWFLICSFLQKGISTITTPIFTRLLTPQEYGQFSVFSSWMGIISVFVSMNLFSGVFVQGLVKFEKIKDQFASSIQGLSLTLVLIWSAIYWSFHQFWNSLFSLTTIQMLSMLMIIWMSSVFQLWAVEQRIVLKYKQLVAVTLIASIARPALGIILVMNSDDKVTARIIGMAIVDVLAYAWLFFVQLKKGRCFFSARIWKYAILFNLPLIPHYLSIIVLSSADRIMINNMVGSGEAGIYNLAYNISLVMTLFNSALLQTIEPWLYKKIRDHETSEISKVAYLCFLLIAGVNIFLMILAPEIVAIFAPKPYYDAIWVIPPVAMSVFFMFAYSFFAVFEFYYEKTALVMVASTTSAVMNIALNYIFIGLFGFLAAGYTTLFCYILYAGFHYVFMSKICKTQNITQPYQLSVLLAMSAGIISMGLIVLLTYKHPILRYGLLVIALLLVAIKYKTIKGGIISLLSYRKEAKSDSRE